MFPATSKVTEMSVFRNSKFMSMFQFLDRDKDGFITMADFSENITSDSIGQEEEEVDKSPSAFSWWFMFYDYRHPNKNGGKTDAAYFVDRCGEYFARKESKAHITNYYQTIFNFLDTNEDGKISVGDFAVYYKVHNVENDSDIENIFNRLDLDGDGVITQEELVNAGISFWFSDDPKNGFAFLHRIPGLYNIYAP